MTGHYWSATYPTAAGRLASIPPRGPADKERRSTDFVVTGSARPSSPPRWRRSRARIERFVSRELRRALARESPVGRSLILDHFERHRATDYEIIELDLDQVGSMKE